MIILIVKQKVQEVLDICNRVYLLKLDKVFLSVEMQCKI